MSKKKVNNKAKSNKKENTSSSLLYQTQNKLNCLQTVLDEASILAPFIFQYKS